MKASILTSLVAFTLLGAAPQPAPAPTAAPQAGLPAGFTHDSKTDVFGEYHPQPDLKIGKWVLTNITLGRLDDFADYEKGPRDSEFAPFMMLFSDVTSDLVEDESGGPDYYNNWERVVPTAYAIAGSRVAFVGKDAVLGQIVFTGTLDLAGVKRANDEGNDGWAAKCWVDHPASLCKAIVLTGDLAVGGHVVKNVKFRWEFPDEHN